MPDLVVMGHPAGRRAAAILAARMRVNCKPGIRNGGRNGAVFPEKIHRLATDLRRRPIQTRRAQRGSPRQMARLEPCGIVGSSKSVARRVRRARESELRRTGSYRYSLVTTCAPQFGWCGEGMMHDYIL